MKANRFLSALLLLCCIKAHALTKCYLSDSIQVVRVGQHSQGAIFPSSYKTPYRDLERRQKFTPTVEEVLLAEKLLSEQYNNAYEQFPALEHYTRRSVNTNKKFKRYYRQYVGFYNAKGEKIIFIHLMNFRNKKKAGQMFGNWTKEVIEFLLLENQ